MPPAGSSLGTDQGEARMALSEPFVDFYQVLRVEPNCSARSLETAYHLLAKTYHPDHGETADVAKLTEVIDAYKALRDIEDRASYDQLYTSHTGFIFFTPDEDPGADHAALSDADAHTKVLQLLYKRRRENAQDAGVNRYFVQELLDCSDDVFDFHVWYLKEKGLILTTEQGSLAITIAGVDHVISLSKTALREKLMLSQSSDLAGPVRT
jgi:curved DNA-binding protein